MSAVVETRTDTRRRTRREPIPKKKHSIIARYKYHIIKRIETEDFGSFRAMWRKYKGKYEFFCADVFTGDTPTYHLSEHNLKEYGSHKAWIDPEVKVNGKPVVLVFNADNGAKLRVPTNNVRTTENRGADKDSPAQAGKREEKGKRDVRRPSKWFTCGS